jgi:hypothetical protein
MKVKHFFFCYHPSVNQECLKNRKIREFVRYSTHFPPPSLPSARLYLTFSGFHSSLVERDRFEVEQKIRNETCWEYIKQDIGLCLNRRWRKLLDWYTLWSCGQRIILWEVTQLFRRKHCFHPRGTLKARHNVITMKTALQFFTAVNTLNPVLDW